ncbi:MAG: DUF433 domain-containing protein [Acidobacteriota bacterium]
MYTVLRPSIPGDTTLNDPRTIGAYGITEAAQYLRLPASTLRTWVHGQSYATAEGRQRSEPLIQLPEDSPSQLSFINLVEAHVLKAIRRQHGISMQNVRPALEYLEDELQVEHPLTSRELRTDGVHLFVNHLGDLVNLSKRGQLAVKSLLNAHLSRIEHDREGLARRLFPFVHQDAPREDESDDAPRIIVLDPERGFGRPTIDGTSIHTETIAQRLASGESLHDLSQDYGLETAQIEEAIRYHLAA